MRHTGQISASRRMFLALGLACATAPRFAWAATVREVTWDDLIPPGVPYSQIIGEGEKDEVNDTWNPIFDANATKMNEALIGALIRMPGFIIPLDISAKGVTRFLLVPYVGACIHVPPPPPNQLVLVTARTPWPDNQLWDPVWVTGIMQMQLQSTEFGATGYSLIADEIKDFEW